MERESFIDDIGLGDNNRLSRDYGYFDTLALSASYAFSYQEYINDKRRATPDQPLTELLKTTLHETTHLYQILATPYGLYYSTLKLLQTDLIRRLTRLLPQKYKIQPLPPLTKSCGKIKSENNHEIKHLLCGWAMAELMVLYLEGNYDGYYNLLNNSLLGTTSIANYFDELEMFVTIFLNANGKPCEVIDSRLETSDTSPLSELQFLGLKALSYPDSRGILESWGKVAEYWIDQPRQLTECPELFPHNIKADLVDYYMLLHEAKNAISAETVGDFILSYMALCEIALSPPLLPYYRSFRTNITIREMNPLQRMWDLFTAVRGITPIRNLERDYVRFTEQVCSKLKWPTPIAIARETLKSLKFPPGDRLFEFYMKAQEFRVRIPHIFLDLGVWFLPERIYTREFHYYFSHPVIEFKDRIGHHPDPNVFLFFTEQALINNYARRLFLSKDQSITFPYTASQAELDYFTGLLEPDLKVLFGINPVKVVLVNPD